MNRGRKSSPNCIYCIYFFGTIKYIDKSYHIIESFSSLDDPEYLRPFSLTIPLYESHKSEASSILVIEPSTRRSRSLSSSSSSSSSSNLEEEDDTNVFKKAVNTIKEAGDHLKSKICISKKKSSKSSKSSSTSSKSTETPSNTGFPSTSSCEVEKKDVQTQKEDVNQQDASGRLAPPPSFKTSSGNINRQVSVDAVSQMNIGNLDELQVPGEEQRTLFSNSEDSRNGSYSCQSSNRTVTEERQERHESSKTTTERSEFSEIMSSSSRTTSTTTKQQNIQMQSSMTTITSASSKSEQSIHYIKDDFDTTSLRDPSLMPSINQDVLLVDMKNEICEIPCKHCPYVLTNNSSKNLTKHD